MTRDAFSDRPQDHIEGTPPRDPVIMPRLGPGGWIRWGWRQLTSMRTALLLLLLLAVAAVPGSLFPQRTSDPNGVVQAFRQDPARAEFLDSLSLFAVYTSPWFSAIYLLLFVSLIGCVVPRTRHHLSAITQPPPRTPKRLDRLSEYRTITTDSDADDVQRTIERAQTVLKSLGYRTVRFSDDRGTPSVAGERGYLRETGNLVFHVALIFILASVGIGGGFAYAGQRVVVEGQSFVNSRAAYDSFTQGGLFSDDQLAPFSLTLDSFAVDYIENDIENLGFVTDYRADVSVLSESESPSRSQIKVNEPLNVNGAEIYLLGNGYAPRITVRDPAGSVVFSELIPFLPQDSNLTSLGVIKVPDGLSRQLGLLGFFYPTKALTMSGAFTSIYPDLQNPVLTLNVFTGDLGIDAGTPRSVYSLDTSAMTQLTGGTTGVDSLQLSPGDVVQLPNDMGSVALEEVRRFASFDIAYDPTKTPVFVSVAIMFTGLMLGLFIPRRRVWIRVGPDSIEYAGLSRGDDPSLGAALDAVVRRHQSAVRSPRER